MSKSSYREPRRKHKFEYEIVVNDAQCDKCWSNEAATHFHGGKTSNYVMASISGYVMGQFNYIMATKLLEA